MKKEELKNKKNEDRVMPTTKLITLSSLYLIRQLVESDAEEMVITQNDVTIEGKVVGSYKVLIEKIK